MTQDPQAIEAFLIHEARLLDDRRFQDWLGLFTDDGWYWVPIEPGLRTYDRILPR